MLWIADKNAKEQEWRALLRAEDRLQKRRQREAQALLERLLQDKIPAKLEGLLCAAFSKAFSLVFAKGRGLIEKTYVKEDLARAFLEDRTLAQEENSRAAYRRISLAAKRASASHLLFAGAEGSVLGLLGIGLADIPIFSALLLRNLYHIALSYGFSYDSLTERIFILSIIEAALLRGEDFVAANAALNAWLDTGQFTQRTESEQIARSAAALSQHLLYLKFVQGIPIVGLFGGLSDPLCLHRVSQYAQLKYKRRFLQQGYATVHRPKLD